MSPKYGYSADECQHSRRPMHGGARRELGLEGSGGQLAGWWYLGKYGFSSPVILFVSATNFVRMLSVLAKSSMPHSRAVYDCERVSERASGQRAERYMQTFSFVCTYSQLCE